MCHSPNTLDIITFHSLEVVYTFPIASLRYFSLSHCQQGPFSPCLKRNPVFAVTVRKEASDVVDIGRKSAVGVGEIFHPFTAFQIGQVGFYKREFYQWFCIDSLNFLGGHFRNDAKTSLHLYTDGGLWRIFVRPSTLVFALVIS